VNLIEAIEQDGRLIILKELGRQTDGRLNETLLTTVLDIYGITRSRDWVRTQIRALAELGAVTFTEQGTVFVAEITRKGIDHVDRRIVLEGVAKPSPVN
jgi:hypothetical protein